MLLNAADALHLGTETVDAVYLGEHRVWPQDTSVLITDDFSRHPDGPLSGKSTETGEEWVNVSGRGTAMVVSGHVVGNGGRSASVVNTGLTGGIVSGLRYGTDWPSLFARADLAGGRYYTETSGNTVYMERHGGTVFAQFNIPGGGGLAGTVHSLSVEEVPGVGTRLRYFIDGVALLRNSAPFDDYVIDTDSGRALTGTYFGCGSEQSGGWSDFKFEGA